MLLLWISVAPSANALSCVPLKELIFAQCSGFICEEPIYIKEISGQLSCSRRPVLESTPNWAKHSMEYELNKSQLSAPAVYVLELNRRYWYKDHEVKSIDDYIRLSTDEKTSMFFRPRINVSDTLDISRVHEEWKEKEKSEYLANLSWIAIDWVSLLAFITIIGYSVKWFRSWLLEAATRKWLVYSVGSQVLIFTLATLSTSSWSGLLIGLLFLVIPLVWLYEVIYLAYTKLRAKST